MIDPLRDVTLEAMVAGLVEAYGFDELAKRLPIACFQQEPSVAAAVAFLAQTAEARAQVERVYRFHLRAQPAQHLTGAARLRQRLGQGLPRQVGVGRLFGPGTPTTDLVDYIKEWFAARQSQEA